MIAPKIARSVEAFIETFMTQARLEQAVFEVAAAEPTGEHRKERMGAFLDWLREDIQKEGEAEMMSGGLSYQDVASEVTARAKAWFLSRG